MYKTEKFKKLLLPGVHVYLLHSSSTSVPSTAVNGSGNVEALIASYWIGTFTYQLSSPDVLELTVGTVGTVGRSSDDACSGLLANKSSNGHHHSAG